MVSVLFFVLTLLIGSGMGFLTNDAKFSKHYLHRISRNNEQQRIFRNIMGKLIDTETNTIYSLDGQKQQGILSNAGPSADPSTKYLEDLACLEACYKCVEDYPLTTVRFFYWKIRKCFFFFRLFSARKRRPIIVDRCAIVLTVVLICQSTR